jgi:hypothetical protein
MSSESSCAYCRSPRWLLAAGLERDHIIPASKGGDNSPENICWACHKCNQFKGAKLSIVDPKTEDLVPLFHPNLQNWHDHFRFSDDGSTIVGLTSIGRATILALRMNRPEMIALRMNWQELGWKPS